MKKAIVSLVALIFCVSTFAQNSPGDGSERNKKMSKEKPKRKPGAYFQLSTGLNNNAGLLGIGFDIPVAKKVSVELGVGLSSWGYKYYLCGKYYFKPDHRGWALGLGATYNTGLEGFVTNQETTYGVREDVELHLLPQVNGFVAAYKYWDLGKRYNRFWLELGLSMPFVAEKFEQTGGDPMSDNAKAVTNFIAPGGLIVGVGFSFGGYR